MTGLMELPEEIIIIIIKQLDIKSIYNLYKTCGTLRNIILMKGVIRICNLTCNTLSTPKSLQLDMIKRISGHLYELNLCGVSNLSKSTLLPALKNMKCLKTLDVSYTEICVLDVLLVYTICPTIKNITMNISDLTDLPNNVLRDLQEVFKNFKNVHFVMRMWMANLALQILEKSSLDTLKFTLCEMEGIVINFAEMRIKCPFKHFCIFMVNYRSVNAYHGTWKDVLLPLKMENIEFIILEYDTTYSLCTSPQFVNFFTENFKITSFTSFDINRNILGTAAIFIWNKETTVFDELFYCNLEKRIKEIFACELKVSNDQTLPLDIDTHCYDWFHIFSTEEGIQRNKANSELDFKRRRIAQTDHILEYDKIFSKHKNVKLSLHIVHPINVTLLSSNEYLRKLTYLSLSGTVVRYSIEFFNILFRCCRKLITLNVEASTVSPCCSSITRSVPLSQSLKNLRLVDKRIDFKTLFSSFTQCKALENICVIDTCSEFNEMADLRTLYQCENLYNLHIQAEMKKYTMSKMIAMNKALLKNRFEHINFILEYPRAGTSCLGYSPYLNVFRLNPIKPV